MYLWNSFNSQNMWTMAVLYLLFIYIYIYIDCLSIIICKTFYSFFLNCNIIISYIPLIQALVIFSILLACSEIHTPSCLSLGSKFWYFSRQQLRSLPLLFWHYMSEGEKLMSGTPRTPLEWNKLILMTQRSYFSINKGLIVFRKTLQIYWIIFMLDDNESEFKWVITYLYIISLLKARHKNKEKWYLFGPPLTCYETVDGE